MENVNIQEITPELLFEHGFSVELVVRKHPKPAPICKRKKDESYVIIREVTQIEMDAAVETAADAQRRKRERQT